MKATNVQDRKYRRRSAGAGLLLVLVAAVTLEATSLIQSYFAQKGLKEEASMRAETQMDATINRIMDIVNQTESAVRNSEWIAQWCLGFLDSLPNVSRRIVADNPVVMGSTLALVPGYSRRYPLYAPYAFREADTLSLVSLATEAYDYPSQEWFREPLERNAGYWSEPYTDEGGGEVLMTTFSVPIADTKGRPAAVLTADIALDWLTELLGQIQIYPNACSFMASREGRLMVSETPEFKALQEAPQYQSLHTAMMAGNSGNVTLKYQDRKSHAYYAPVERTGWSMCILIPDEDIYGSFYRTSLLVLVFQLLGLVLLILILQSFVRSQMRYKKLNEKRERMEGELHIASNIQMSMVPKVFPPFPERDDLDMAAAIVPAKEVGGDLYDYYIRDNKLFFCIGDVSGKGVPASLVMAVTRTTFRSVSAHEDSPGKIVTAMNESLADMNENDMFVTFFCGVLDLENGHLHYCNAGHNPPAILTDSIRSLPVEANLPLGVMPGMPFREQETPFRYDDALFLYTDGLTEAENMAHEQFGLLRMEDALRNRKGAYEHLKDMEQAVSAFVGDAPQSDDLTMLFIHYLGKDPESLGTHLFMHNDVRQIRRLEPWLDGVAKEYNLDPMLVPGLNLALEEAVTNVVLYAYPKGSYGSIELDAARSGNQLRFVLSDAGKPYDPTARPPVDITAGVEERPIGGLGVHLVRQIMDSVTYEWKDGHNILTMIKNI